MIRLESTRSLRRAYLDWIEEQIEDFKDSIPRSDLLRLADQVVEELRLGRRGQYQLTELMLCDAVDRKIFRMLKLPGYKRWCASREASVVCGLGTREEEEEAVIPDLLTPLAQENATTGRALPATEERPSLPPESGPAPEPVLPRPRKEFPTLVVYSPRPVHAVASL